METIIEIFLSGLLLIGSGSIKTAVICEVELIPTLVQVVFRYTCQVGMGQETVFILTGLVYQGAIEQPVPRIETY